MTDQESGFTFTERCRRMLAEQPSQAEFTLSRGGLETLVLDSERLAIMNAQAVREHLEEEERAERMRPRDLNEQMTALIARYPDAHLEPSEQSGYSLLYVPGVERSAIWKNRVCELIFLLPDGFPYSQPHRFLTSDDDTLLAHGGQASNIIGPINGAPPSLLQWHWAITSRRPQHTLLDHVNAARRRFEFANASDLESA